MGSKGQGRVDGIRDNIGQQRTAGNIKWQQGKAGAVTEQQKTIMGRRDCTGQQGQHSSGSWGSRGSRGSRMQTEESRRKWGIRRRHGAAGGRRVVVGSSKHQWAAGPSMGCRDPAFPNGQQWTVGSKIISNGKQQWEHRQQGKAGVVGTAQKNRGSIGQKG